MMANKLDFDESVKTLKQTIPLMMKYSVPVNPTNYALWFTYVSNELPSLNQELDAAIALYDTCPTFRTEQLYNKHINYEAADKAKKFQKSVDSTISKVGNTIGVTQKDTRSFEASMTACHDELVELDKVETPVSQDEIASFITDLLDKSLAMKDNVHDLNTSLDAAQAEIKKLREALENSQQDALYDALTGLLNRRAFNQEISALQGVKNVNAFIILADIDKFKIFNDTHGHPLGDQVLKTVAKRLETVCKNNGTAFRYGGEEFSILIPKSTVTAAHDMAERVRLSIERLVIKDRSTGNTVANITCSFGVAPLTSDVHESIKLADTRLYTAKNQGRNRVISS